MLDLLYTPLNIDKQEISILSKLYKTPIFCPFQLRTNTNVCFVKTLTKHLFHSKQTLTISVSFGH